MAENTFALTARRYDQAILHPAMRALFQGTDLYNIGFWRGADGASIAELGAACRRLVERHLEVDDGPRAAVKTVLDVGCGLGATTRMFAAAYPAATTVGINFSHAQLQHALHREGPAENFVAMDATRLGIASAAVERIHCVEAAMHFAPRSEFLIEAARVLVPGGRLVLTDILPTAANDVVPAANIVADLTAYLATCRACGLEPVHVEDITADSMVPFCDHMQRRGHGNIARYFAAMVDRYILAVLVRPADGSSSR